MTQETSADVEKTAYRAGVKAVSPMILGVAAWGMVTGIAMIKSGLTLWQSLGMTFIVFAGSAQLASLPLIVANAPIWVVFLTGLLVNLRFVIYSAVISPHFAHLPWHKRLAISYFNADVTTALFPQRFPPETVSHPAGKLGYFNGIVHVNWWAWQIGSVIGILLGSQIPQNWGIGYAGTLALLAITIPLIANKATLVGVVVASVVSVLALRVPYHLGMLVAAITGMAAAMLFESWMEKRKARA
jgi:predicted branched-subunit amino acid permease